MDNKKNILYINLAEKNAESKIHADLDTYIGGLGFALKISADLKERNKITNLLTLTTGPLTGFFPGCDRAIAVFEKQKKYLDGSCAIDLKKAGFSGLVVYNTSENPYYLVINKEGARFGDAGLLADLSVKEKKKWLKEHEVESGSTALFPEEYSRLTNLQAIVINSKEELTVPNTEMLDKVRMNLWGDQQVNIISRDDCHWSNRWKDLKYENEQMLLDSLVANEQTANIYKQIPVSFACLEAVGETHTHEELENFHLFLFSS